MFRLHTHLFLKGDAREGDVVEAIGLESQHLDEDRYGAVVLQTLPLLRDLLKQLCGKGVCQRKRGQLAVRHFCHGFSFSFFQYTTINWTSYIQVHRKHPKGTNQIAVLGNRVSSPFCRFIWKVITAYSAEISSRPIGGSNLPTIHKALTWFASVAATGD